MRYAQEIEPYTRNVLRQAIRFNEPIPERIANRPQLLPGLEFFYVAWFELDSERSVGMGLGPIPRRAIVEYGKDYALPMEQIEDALYLLREMDNDYLRRQAKKKPGKGKEDGKEDAS